MYAGFEKLVLNNSRPEKILISYLKVVKVNFRFLSYEYKEVHQVMRTCRGPGNELTYSKSQHKMGPIGQPHILDALHK
jgi:hypothetical protein